MAVVVKKTAAAVSPTTEKGEDKVNATAEKKTVRVSRKAAPKEAATLST